MAQWASEIDLVGSVPCELLLRAGKKRLWKARRHGRTARVPRAAAGDSIGDGVHYTEALDGRPGPRGACA